MVAVAIEPLASGMRAQGVSLVLAFVLEQVVAAEYVVVAEFQA
jgi:hypothetical protein